MCLEALCLHLLGPFCLGEAGIVLEPENLTTVFPALAQNKEGEARGYQSWNQGTCNQAAGTGDITQ